MTVFAELPRDPALSAIASFRTAHGERRQIVRLVHNLPSGKFPTPLRRRVRTADAALARAYAKLSKSEPETLRGARELLSVAVTLLQDARVRLSPELFGDAPVIEILERVKGALDAIVGPDALPCVEAG